MRITLIIATLLLSACPGGPYDPCESVEDCDPALVDACANLPGAKPICTLVCQTSKDCPLGPDGGGPGLRPRRQDQRLRPPVR